MRPQGSYLYYNHSKRIDIRSLADRSFPVQNLWCSPPHRMTICNRLRRTKFRGNDGKSKVGQTRMACFIHENAWLKHRSARLGGGFLSNTNSLEIPMDDAVGMEEVETINDIKNLTKGWVHRST